MRYQLQFPRNENVLLIHVDLRLTDKTNEMYLGRESLNGLDGGDPAPIWLTEIYDLDGIDGTSFIHRYELHVSKGELFSWDDLAPKIVEILRRYLCPDGEATEVSGAKRWTSTEEAEYLAAERRDSIYGF